MIASFFTTHTTIRWKHHKEVDNGEYKIKHRHTPHTHVIYLEMGMLMNENKGNETSVPKKCAKENGQMKMLSNCICIVWICVCISGSSVHFWTVSFSCQKKKQKRYRPYIQKFLDHLVYLFLSLIFLEMSLFIYLISILLAKRSGFDVQKQRHRLNSITKYTHTYLSIQNENRLNIRSRIRSSSGRSSG